MRTAKGVAVLALSLAQVTLIQVAPASTDSPETFLKGGLVGIQLGADRLTLEKLHKISTADCHGANLTLDGSKRVVDQLCLYALPKGSNLAGEKVSQVAVYFGHDKVQMVSLTFAISGDEDELPDHLEEYFVHQHLPKPLETEGELMFMSVPQSLLPPPEAQVFMDNTPALLMNLAKIQDQQHVTVSYGFATLAIFVSEMVRK